MYNSKIKHVHLHPQGMHKETKEGWGGSCMVLMCDIAAREIHKICPKERTLLQARQEASMHDMGQCGMPHPACTQT